MQRRVVVRRGSWQAWAFGVVTIAVAMGFAAAAALAIRSDAAALAYSVEISRSRASAVLGARAQAVVEPLARAAMGAPGENVTAAREAFAALLEALGPGAYAGRSANPAALRGSDEIARIAAGLAQRRDEILALGRDDAAGAEALLIHLAPLAQALTARAERAGALEGKAAAALAQQARSGSVNTLRMIGAAGALAVLGLAFAAWLMMRARTLTAEKAAIAEKAGAAERAHVRLLATIDRELRGPMNGVLTPLTEMNESGLSADQAALRISAEHAVRQIGGLFDDLLTEEMGRGRDATPDRAPFRLATLAQDMRNAFGPIARRSGARFEAVCRTDALQRLQGDRGRFQRAISHLCGYALDRAGARNVDIEFSHGDGKMRAALAFDYPPGGGDVATLRDLVAARAIDAPSALGPLLAKGVLDRIGGRLEISTLDDGRVLALASAPADLAEAEGPRIRIVAESLTLASLGAASVRAGGLDLLAADAAPAPDIVLMEAGGAGERVALAQVRARYPEALLIALGDPVTPGAFDGVIRAPFLPERMVAEITRVWTTRRAANDEAAVALPRRAMQG